MSCLFLLSQSEVFLGSDWIKLLVNVGVPSGILIWILMKRIPAMDKTHFEAMTDQRTDHTNNLTLTRVDFKEILNSTRTDFRASLTEVIRVFTEESKRRDEEDKKVVEVLNALRAAMESNTKVLQENSTQVGTLTVELIRAGKVSETIRN